jgi:hypothetical protein
MIFLPVMCVTLARASAGMASSALFKFMFRRFLEGADKRLPCLAEAKTNLSKTWKPPICSLKEPPEHKAGSTMLQGYDNEYKLANSGP